MSSFQPMNDTHVAHTIVGCLLRSKLQMSCRLRRSAKWRSGCLSATESRPHNAAEQLRTAARLPSGWQIRCTCHTRCGQQHVMGVVRRWTRAIIGWRIRHSTQGTIIPEGRNLSLTSKDGRGIGKEKKWLGLTRGAAQVCHSYRATQCDCATGRVCVCVCVSSSSSSLCGTFDIYSLSVRASWRPRRQRARTFGPARASAARERRCTDCA
eukprot:COSAG01_NODE_905_length_12840_cov_12.409544_10_plen_210_part_00